ncbi:MAG: hypothetical protein K9K37_09645 [Desulfocapsa sp.]|nr:hypothetical protein [Desulfocapsa sp.]
MKQCSLSQFTESLTPWLDNNYIRSVTLRDDDRVVFSFVDGVNDVYEINDCNRSEIDKVCRDLQEKGIKVLGLA